MQRNFQNSSPVRLQKPAYPYLQASCEMWCGSIGKDAVRGKRSERQNYGALPAYNKNESWTPHDDACRGRLVNFGQPRPPRAWPCEHLNHITWTLPNDRDTNIPMGSCPRHEASTFVHTAHPSLPARVPSTPIPFTLPLLHDKGGAGSP